MQHVTVSSVLMYVGFNLQQVQRYKEREQNENRFQSADFSLVDFIDKEDRLSLFFALVDLLMRSASQ